MDDAAAAVAEGVRTVVRNPVIVGAAALVLLALVPVLAVVSVVGFVLSFLLVGPFVVRFTGAIVAKPLLFGGLAGVADAGLDDAASLGDLTDGLSGSYLSLAGAYVLHEIAVLVLAIVAGIAAFALLALGTSLPVVAEGTTRLGAIGVGAVGAVVLAGLALTLQFVDVATVVGGADARDALRESVRLTRSDPVGVLWYTALRLLLFAVVVLPGVVVAVAEGRLGPPFPAFGWAVTGLLLPVAFAAVTAAHVAYYRERTTPG